MYTTGKLDWTMLEEGASEAKNFASIHDFLASLPSRELEAHAREREIKFILTMPYAGGPTTPVVEFRSWFRRDLSDVLQGLEAEYGNEPLTLEELAEAITEVTR